MIRGPKIKLILYQYTLADDGGGSKVPTWSEVKTIKGVLTFIGGDERERESKETLYGTYQFWCQYQKEITISEKDRFTNSDGTSTYTVLFCDNILEMNKYLKINLLKVT